MKKYIRVVNFETLENICKTKKEIAGVIVGHENCPHYYRQSRVDQMIQAAQTNGLEVRVNIPVIFESYLKEFQDEAVRLLTEYQGIKLIVNDWGMLYYLHGVFPEKKFAAGKGFSFTYGDNPWNEHILLAEKEKYREILKAHNMENPDTIKELKRMGIDEIELSDLAMSENAYKHLHEEGFVVTINKDMSIVTMSRACHCLRFLNKLDEMGSCIQYCSRDIVLSIKKYYDMVNTEHKELSPETKQMQPDMLVHGNIVMVKNTQVIDDYSNVDNIVYDERINWPSGKMQLC